MEKGTQKSDARAEAVALERVKRASERLVALRDFQRQRRYRKLIGKCFMTELSYEISPKVPPLKWKRFFKVTKVKDGELFGEELEYANFPEFGFRKLRLYDSIEFFEHSCPPLEEWQFASLQRFRKAQALLQKSIASLPASTDSF